MVPLKLTVLEFIFRLKTNLSTSTPEKITNLLPYILILVSLAKKCSLICLLVLILFKKMLQNENTASVVSASFVSLIVELICNL